MAPGIYASCPPDDRDARFKDKLGTLKQRQKTEEIARDSTKFIYNAKESPRIFNMYYQRLAPMLLSLEDYKTSNQWHSISSGEKTSPLLHTLEHELILGYGKTHFKTLKAGDLAEVWTTLRVEIRDTASNEKTPYVLLRLAGIARISDVGDTVSRASLVQSFYPLNIELAKTRPLVPIKSLNVRSYTPVDVAKFSEMGRIRLSIDKGLIAGQYSYVMVDKGTAQGFRDGSAVAFWEADTKNPSLPPRLLGKGIVTRSGKQESAVLVREIYSHMRRLDVGNLVSLTHQPVLQ